MFLRTRSWGVAGGAVAVLVTIATAIAGPSVRSYASGSSRSTWTPDSADVLFASNRDGNSEIYLRAAGSGEWTNLTQDPGSDNWPEWSPDGRRIAFQSSRAGQLDIWLMEADGSKQTRLTDHPEPDYLPAWSPDGRHITFTSWRREPQDTARAPHVYIMNADGSNQRRLIAVSLETSSGATWSRDGRWITFSRRHGENGARVCVTRSDGGGERVITDGAAYDGTPVFSPNGRRIAFYSDGGNASAIAVVNPDGKGRRTLVGSGRNWYPRWSPDGRWLLYTAVADTADTRNLDLFAVPVDGGAPVFVLGGQTRESEGRWRPTPAGQRR